MNNHSVVRQIGALTALATAAALALSGCSGGGAADQTIESAAPDQPRGTVEFWHFFTDREADGDRGGRRRLRDGQSRRSRSGRQVRPGRRQDAQAIAAGDRPRRRPVLLDRHRRQVLLTPALGSTSARTSSATRSTCRRSPTPCAGYTEFDGKRCAMPFLADAYGLYYNKDMSPRPASPRRRRRWPSSTDMAKKLTKRKADGTIETPASSRCSASTRTPPAHYGADGRREVAQGRRQVRHRRRPGWQELLTWQKELVDWYRLRQAGEVPGRPR